MIRVLILFFVLNQLCSSDITYLNKLSSELTWLPAALPTEYTQPSNSNLVGTWLWEKNDQESHFSLRISQQDQFIVGKYCYTIMSGQKTDCAIRTAYSFKIKNTNVTSFTTDFYSQFSNTKGKAKITLDSDSLIWEILQEPTGEYYCPKKAILRKQ